MSTLANRDVVQIMVDEEILLSALYCPRYRTINTVLDHRIVAETPDGYLVDILCSECSPGNNPDWHVETYTREDLWREAYRRLKEGHDKGAVKFKYELESAHTTIADLKGFLKRIQNRLTLSWRWSPICTKGTVLDLVAEAFQRNGNL